MIDTARLPDELITLQTVEPDLSPARIDDRLAAGWFPWGGRWMTCRAWALREGTRDTIWVRVRLALRPPSDRRRRLAREGCFVQQSDAPKFDEEHQLLYARFRDTRHPDWVPDAADLLHPETESGLLSHTREVAVRDASGRLIAFRWFLKGATTVAGLTAIFDTTRAGLGTIARTLADEWAAEEGLTWSYPGYVLPGAENPWYYKIKRGRTEWFDPEKREWRTWDGDEPRLENLALAEIRRRLSQVGEVVHYPAWPLAYLHPSPRRVAAPYYVVGSQDGNEMTLIIWSLDDGCFRELRVVKPSETPEAAGEASSD